MPGTRDRRTRHRAGTPRSLRSSFVLPFVIPAVCVSGLWGYTAAGLVDDQAGLHTDAGHVASVARPAQQLLARLQDERRLTALWQASRTDPARADLDSARARTDTALAEYRRHAAAADTAALRRRAGAYDGALKSLADRRAAIDARKLSSGDAFAYFTDAASQGLALLTAAVRGDDARTERAGTATVAVARITELLSREDALVTAALPGHRIPAADRARFGRYAAVRTAAREGLAAADLPGGTAATYDRITSGPQWRTVASAEQAVGDGQGTALPRDATAWPAAADGVVHEFQALTDTSLGALSAHATDRARDLLLVTLLGSAATLAAVAAATVLALRTRRSALGRLTEFERLSQELAGLRSGTEHLAAVRLPELLARLEKGERVDPAALTPHRQHSGDEIGRLSSAVDQLARVAADSVLRQSQGRQGSDKVVGQLIRRAQVLIHRLIALLDDLERKHEDSDLLKDIFRVDHLATRVRRHAENLMILSGAPPSRRMTRPVAITDVMRGAVAETEHYTRVRVRNTPADRRVALAGRAVADVTHLLAELIENGTSFSPPDTEVTVSTARVAKGLAVHVEDQGLGMPAEMLERANELLAQPPRVDMTVFGEDPRLGHFVVARLAERHGIKVVLRESDYGGTRALVMLPAALLEDVSSPVVDQLQSAAVAAGRAVGSPADPQLTDGGQYAAAGAVQGALTAAAGPPAGADEVIVHAAMPDHNGFPEYGGAGLLPPAASDHPAPSPAFGPVPDAPGTGARTPATTPYPPGPPSHTPGRAPAGAHPPAGQPGPSAPSAPPAPPAFPAPPAGSVPPDPHPPASPYAPEAPSAPAGPYVPEDRHAPPAPSSSPAADASLRRSAVPRQERPAPATDHPSAAAVTPAAPAAGASAPDGAPDTSGPLTTPSVLPQRVRGASLAQQLRREAAYAEDEPAGGSDDDVISPDASARAMSAIHQGLKRAWMSEDDDTPHGAHGRQSDAAGPPAHEL
ncbi:nitrate- and nitrite sensing domain-containing protein [Streptomyces sp. NPDC006743]|uniref:sensor histidine kinase n=1 Tax=Streptomyces sp. NPDC006743 TaxID=3154480 RepID=UPI003454714B